MFSTVQKRLRTKQRRFLQGVKRYIKRVHLFYKRRKYLCLAIATTFFLLILSLFFFSTSRIKPNDDILFLRTYNKAILENRNPTFNVSFGQRNDLEKQWVRFEAKVAKKNPFEEKERNFFSNLLDLVNSRKTLGVELSLKQVGEKEVKTSTELIEVKKLKKEDDTYLPSEKPVVLNPNVVKGVDIEYQILEGLGLKEDIIIRDLGLSTEECKDLKDCNLPFNELIFDLKLDKGVSLRKAWYTDNGGSTEIFYFTDNRGNYIGHFLPSWAIDSKGVKTHDVGIKIIDESNSNSKIKVVVNKEWLLDEERVFPVRIDPTIVHDSELDFEEGSFLNTEVRDGPELGLKEVKGSLIDANTVGLWRLDEESGSGAYIQDSSGNNNYGTPVGTTYVKGKIGGARSFNGSSDTISMGNILAFERTNPFTLEAWIKTTETAASAVIAKMSNSAPYRGYNLHIDQNTIYVQIIGTWSSSTIAVRGTTPINTGDWTHVVTTYDGSSNANGVKIYINGKQDQTNIVYNNLTTTIVTTDVLRIGSRTGGAFFPGDIDEVRISNITRTPGEIMISYLNGLEEHSGHYTSPDIDLGTSADLESISWDSVGVNTGDGEIPYSDDGLVAQWNFNEASGTTAVNTGSCGTACNGTLTNFSSTTGRDVVAGSGWTHTHRKWGDGALMFDGSNDYVDAGSNSALSLSTYSISGWFKTGDSSDYKVITNKGAAAENRNWWITVWKDGAGTHLDGSLVWRSSINGSWTNGIDISSNTKVTDNRWHYFVVTLDGANGEAKMYLDGNLKASQNFSGTVGVPSVSTIIGNDPSTSGRNFNGVIDSLSIYNRVLYEEEILSNYQAGNIEFQYRYTVLDDENDSGWIGGSENTINNMNNDMSNWNTDAQGIMGRVPISIQDTNPSRPSAPTGCLNNLPVVINNLGSNSAISDYQVKLNVDYKNGMESDFSDLRFTNSSGQNLPHWIEEYTSSGKATVWFKLDTVGSNSSTYVYMWYNSCTGGLVNNGDSVFEFFDDFEFADTNKFTYNQSFGGSNPMLYNISNGVLRLNSDSTWRVLRMKKDFAPTDRVAVGTRFQKAGASSASPSIFVETADPARNRFGLQDNTAGITRVQYRRTSDSTWQYSATLSTLSPNTWYKSEILKQSSNRFEAKLFTDSGTKEGITFSHTSSDWNNITWTWLIWQLENIYLYYDWLYVRKYIDQEPVVYFQDSNVLPYVADNSGLNSSLKIDTSGDSIIDANTIGYWKLDENNKSSMIPIDSNLVGYWDFIESSGSGAYLLDKSTNTNNATPSGTSYAVGIKEGGRSFNGSSNFITIPHHNSLSFERTDSYTLEAWFKTTTTSNQRLITKMNHGDASLKGYDLNIINGVIRTHLTGTWSSSAIQVDGTTNVTNGQWNHVIVTYNGSSSANGMKIYLNGQLENMSINNNNLSSTTVNTENVVFGKRSGSDTAYFNGTLDEVGIYNRELTALEIEERFNSTKDIIDYSENNNHGYSQGTTYTPGRIEGARSFNGSSDAIMIPHSTSLKPQFPITISAWIKPEVLNTGSFIFRNDRAECSGSGENRYNGIWFNINESNQVNIHYGNGGTCGTASRRTKNSATTLTSPNTWYHVAGVIRGATDMDIYINGQDAGGTYSGTGGALTYTTDRDSYIGARGDNSVFDNYFKGIIDGVQFSNVARTHAEIYELYSMGKDHYINKTLTLEDHIDLTDSTMLPFWIASDTLGFNLEFTYGNNQYDRTPKEVGGLVGYWDFQESSGDGAYLLDKSGNQNHGTPIGTTYTKGQMGAGRNFNGTSDHIPLGTSGRPTNNFTVEAWFTTNVTHQIDTESTSGTGGTAGQRFLFWPNHESANAGSGISVGTNGISVYEHGSSYMPAVAVYNGTLPSGWNHLIVTYTAKRPRIYLNGNLVRTGLTSPRTSVFAPYIIGGSSYGYHSGDVDEVVIYNWAFTATDVQKRYYSSLYPDIGRKSHPIIVNFKADLQSSDLITNSNDLSFTIDETPYGATNTIENIDKEEKIIIKENYNGTEYIAQGDIKTVNKNTGAITVDSWDTESTFPSNGFSENATVFKWQREYIDTRYLLPEDKDSISQLTFRKTTGEPATFWIDDMKKAKYLTDSSGDTFEEIEGVTNVQYRPIFTTWDETVSSNFYLTSVSLDYNSLPLPPTDLLVEGQTNPSSLYLFGLKFSAIFNDDNILDTAEEYHIQVNTKNDWTGTMMWDSGWTEMTSTAVGNRSPDIIYDGNTLSNATTYYWRIKFKDNYGGEGAWSTETAYFTTDSPPSAPTNLLTERRTNPDNIKTTNPIFSAIYNDPDQDDTSSYYEIYVNTQSNFLGDTMWESGKTLMKTTKQGKRSPDITYQGDPLDMNEVTYYWRIRFWDSTEQIGEWSQVAYFTTYNTPPDAPTDLLTDGEFNPPKITGLTPAFTAVFNDPDGKDTGENYRIQVHTQETFTGGTLMWDSGKKSMNSTARGKRSPDIIYNGTGLSFNATKYYWRIKFWDNYDNEGEWSEAAHFTMSGPPFTPTQLKVDGRTNPPDILSINPQFSALFTDPNDDKGTHYRIQVHTQATFTGNTLMWDSSKQSMNHTPSNAHSPSIPYNGTTLTGTSGAVYYWRIKFWDSDGLESGWSSTGTFIDKITQTSLRFEGVGMEGIKVD